jgi:alkanesulfonate monooxygenase
MTIDVYGMVSTAYGSESAGWSGPVIDPQYLTDFARAHERSGFDRILVAQGATTPDPLVAAGFALAKTDEIGVLVAQRPGFIAPTMTARKLATLEHLHGEGRVAIHHITGGSDVDQRRDGDFEDKDSRYRRTAEFMAIERLVFESDEPFDFDGEFYRVEGGQSSVRPLAPGSIPLFFGGASDAALAVGSQHADVFMLWGEPLADIEQRIATIRAAAAANGRDIRFSLSVRPIVEDTEDQAWARAREIEAAATELRRAKEGIAGWQKPREDTSVGAARLHDMAAASDVHDDRLWFGVTKLTDGGGNSTALVGTAEQVAESLLKYYDLGVDTVLIRGFDPLKDVERWGDDLVPLLRQGAAARDAAKAATQAPADADTPVLA